MNTTASDGDGVAVELGTGLRRRGALCLESGVCPGLAAGVDCWIANAFDVFSIASPMQSIGTRRRRRRVIPFGLCKEFLKETGCDGSPGKCW